MNNRSLIEIVKLKVEISQVDWNS